MLHLTTSTLNDAKQLMGLIEVLCHGQVRLQTSLWYCPWKMSATRFSTMRQYAHFVNALATVPCAKLPYDDSRMTLLAALR